MRKTLATLVLILAAFASVANGQRAKQDPSRPSAEVLLQQRVAALEKEVRGLKAELAALRAQIQRSRSARTPVVSESGSKSSATRPSQEDIQTCVNASIGDDLHYKGPIVNVEYGTAFSSQGERGNPSKGTTIYPVKIRFQLSSVKRTLHVFVDSFGLWQCQPVAGT